MLERFNVVSGLRISNWLLDFALASTRGPVSNSRRLTRSPIMTLIGLLLSLYSHTVSGFALSFTNSEWNAWSPFCKDAIVLSKQGSTSSYRRFYPEPNYSRMRADMAGSGGPWHYCAAELLLKRATYGRDSVLRERYLRRAVSEAKFTYFGVRKGKWYWLKERAGIAIGRAQSMLGRFADAESVLLQVITEFPKSEAPYTALYFVYRQSGDKNAGLATLLKGNAAVKGRSAQIHYFLGLIYLDRDDITGAKKHAAKAYALKHPLPGLRNRLATAEKQAASKKELAEEATKSVPAESKERPPKDVQNTQDRAADSHKS